MAGVQHGRVEQFYGRIVGADQHADFGAPEDDGLRPLIGQRRQDAAVFGVRLALDAPDTELVLNHPMDELAIRCRRRRHIEAVRGAQALTVEIPRDLDTQRFSPVDGTQPPSFRHPRRASGAALG